MDSKSNNENFGDFESFQYGIKNFNTLKDLLTNKQLFVCNCVEKEKESSSSTSESIGGQIAPKSKISTERANLKTKNKRFYCFTCREDYCDTCILKENNHQEHLITVKEDILLFFKTDIEKLAEEVDDIFFKETEEDNNFEEEDEDLDKDTEKFDSNQQRKIVRDYEASRRFLINKINIYHDGLIELIETSRKRSIEEIEELFKKYKEISNSICAQIYESSNKINTFLESNLDFYPKSNNPNSGIQNEDNVNVDQKYDFGVGDKTSFLQLFNIYNQVITKKKDIIQLSSNFKLEKNINMKELEESVYKVDDAICTYLLKNKESRSPVLRKKSTFISIENNFFQDFNNTLMLDDGFTEMFKCELDKFEALKKLVEEGQSKGLNPLDLDKIVDKYKKAYIRFLLNLKKYPPYGANDFKIDLESSDNEEEEEEIEENDYLTGSSLVVGEEEENLQDQDLQFSKIQGPEAELEVKPQLILSKAENFKPIHQTNLKFKYESPYKLNHLSIKKKPPQVQVKAIPKPSSISTKKPPSNDRKLRSFICYVNKISENIESLKSIKLVEDTCEIHLYNQKTSKVIKILVNLNFKIHGYSNFLTGCRYTLVGNKLYITGGRDWKQEFKVTLCYDKESNSVTRLPDMYNPRSYHTILYDKKNDLLYVIGGEGNRTCEVFDIALNKWTCLPSLNNPRANPCLIIFGLTHTQLYAMFGSSKEIYKGVYDPSIERLSLNNPNFWEKVNYKNLAEIDTKIESSGILPITSTKALMYGGLENRKLTRTTVIFDYEKNEFSYLTEKFLDDLESQIGYFNKTV